MFLAGSAWERRLGRMFPAEPSWHLGSQGLFAAPVCVRRRMAPGVHADLPYCSDVRPSGTLLVWALFLAGWLRCSPCLAASWDHVL